MSLNACCYAPAAVENKALRVSPLYYDRGQHVAHSDLSCWVVGAEPIIFNSSRRFTFTGSCSATHGLLLS